MAIFHVYASYIKKARTSGAAGFARYLLEGEAQRYGRYLRREERARTDLIASGSAHLPRWARDGEQFWAMASRYERGGMRRQGTVALCYQFTLPRELSEARRRELAADIRDAFFDRYPHTWAIHNPHGGTADEHPHLHVMMSPRREDTPSARGPETWFRQAAPEGQYRIGAGVKKDHGWYGRLEAVRHETAVLINAALEREGLALAVSAQSLKDRGIDRAVSPYDAAAENVVNLKAWHQEKQRRHVDVDREAVLDQVRDRFWMHDQSAYRVQQREASVARTLARVRVLSQRPAQRESQAARRRRLDQVLRLQQALAARQHHEAQVTQGLRVRLTLDDDEERRVRYGR
jgi:hypothetical protein